MVKELYYGIYNETELNKLVEQKKALLLKARRPVAIGTSCMLKVNLNIGVSDVANYSTEIQKLSKISALSYRPDSMMDHTIVQLDKPLWKSMIDTFDGAVGTLPHYLPFDDKQGICESDFFDNLMEMINGGVSFMTLHPTADFSIYECAIKSQRKIPTTSRGGYVLIKDQVINHRSQNLIASNFEKIMEIFSKNNIAVSIGTVFRPATIYEALDEFHRKETILQKKYIDIARSYNVQVMMEGVGHIPFNLMKEYADMIRNYDTPLMPLGPMPSDEIIGFDHISNALGAISMAQTGVVGMINSVTREEHTGQVPSFDSILEGLMTARAVAHCYNIGKFEKYKVQTETIGVTRALKETCVQRGGIFGFNLVDDNESTSCTRCRRECPLKKIIY